MDFKEYQALARRTQNKELCRMDKRIHATLGICAEIGEITEVRYDDFGTRMDELSDLFWFLAELCDIIGFDMDEILKVPVCSAGTWTARAKQARLNEGASQRFLIDCMQSAANSLCGILQKTYQGHAYNVEKTLMEITQLGTSAASLAVCICEYGVEEVLTHNIEKLKKRYPGKGFEVERSVHREC